MIASVRPDVRALASASRDLLNRGDASGAEQVLTPVFNELWGDASVWHLMGLIKQAQKKPQEAERYLRRAVAEALTEGTYYNDLGVSLQARGEFVEAQKIFRAAAALMPMQPAPRVNLVHCLISLGDMGEAERETRAYIAALPGPEAWTLLGQVQRHQGRYEDALASADEALRFAPRMRGLRHNRGIALEKLGRTEEALTIFEALAREDLETPELALNFARTLYHQHRTEDAEKVLEECIKYWPQTNAAYLLLARMRELRGLGEECAEPFEQALAERPNDFNLRLMCADFLHRNGYSARARMVLEAAPPPVTPQMLTALGIVLDGLGLSKDGLTLLRRADGMTNGAAQTQRNLIAPLLRAGNADEALKVARGLRRESLRDQFLLAAEATALRVLGDSAYRGLCDYERQVRTFEIAPPTGFFTADNFNAALAESIRHQLKSASALDNPMPGGVQTTRDLRQVNEPNFREFFAAIDGQIRRYISTLDANDPAGRRRGNGYRLRNTWATLLKPGGSAPNHVHDAGWITVLYFVETPKSAGRAGWLKIGEPFWSLPGMGPERWVEPKPGWLVLFPSYFWHGVETLGGEGERLSIGLDVIPA